MWRTNVPEPLETYRIGEVAALAGVSVETLRFYERRRLLKSPPRTDGGLRRYSADVLDRIRFIKQAQSLGLTLDDIQQLVNGQQHRSSASCRRVHELLSRRIEDIDRRLKELRVFRRTLRGHLDDCERALAVGGEPECPTLDILGARAGKGKWK